MPFGKFVGLDTVTKGNWRTRYGSQGYIFPTKPGASVVDNIAMPPYMNSVTKGSLTPTSLVADGPVASNPLGLVYPDGSAASGAVYAETSPGTQDYMVAYTPDVSTTTYRMSIYVACVDGLARTQTLAILFSLGVADSVTVSLAPYGSVWAQFIYRPTDSRFSRAGVMFASGTPGIVNGVFFDLYRPASFGGFGFPFLGSYGF